jgi:hypothetical protein
VQRSGDSRVSVTVDYTTGDASAKAGVNYAAVSGTLIFEPSENEKRLSVPVFDDGIATGDKTLILTLSNPTGGAVLGQKSATLTILDVERPGGLTQLSNLAVIALAFGAEEDGKMPDQV